MCVDIINYKTRLKNNITDVIMNLNYYFDIIKYKSFGKTRAYVLYTKGTNFVL